MQILTNKVILGPFLAISTVLLFGLLIGGCADSLLGPSESGNSDVRIQGLTPEQVGTLGAKLNQNPRNQSALLSKYDITESQFERAINTISNNPDLSRRYRQAYETEFST